MDINQPSSEEPSKLKANKSQQEEPANTDCLSKQNKLKVFKSYYLRNESFVGVGGFGKVLAGYLRRRHVAIKVFYFPLKMENAQVQIDLLKSLKHRNLARVKGIMLDSFDLTAYRCPPLLIDYFPEGSMLKFLTNKDNPQDYAILIKLALDIVRGCEYLHSKGIIHGNLAARNVMIQGAVGKKKTHFIAKVADYGIHTVAKGCGENHVILPSGKTVSVRWAPKELVINDGEGTDPTFASDVWSFGVVLWEMWSKGAVPFGASYKSMQVIKFLKEDKSPLSIMKPKVCPKHIFKVMEAIFKVVPNERPTFSMLKSELESFKQNFKAKKEKTLKITGNSGPTPKPNFDNKICEETLRFQKIVEEIQRHVEKQNRLVNQLAQLPNADSIQVYGISLLSLIGVRQRKK